MEAALLLRVNQAAELLGVSRSQVYALAQRGDLPGVVRVGQSIRLHRPTLERWLERAATHAKVTAPEVRDAAARPPTHRS